MIRDLSSCFALFIYLRTFKSNVLINLWSHAGLLASYIVQDFVLINYLILASTRSNCQMVVEFSYLFNMDIIYFPNYLYIYIYSLFIVILVALRSKCYQFKFYFFMLEISI
jgi:hypothetical protein